MLRVRGNESLEVIGESEVMMTYNDQVKNFKIRKVASETQNLLIGVYPAQLANIRNQPTPMQKLMVIYLGTNSISQFQGNSSTVVFLTRVFRAGIIKI